MKNAHKFDTRTYWRKWKFGICEMTDCAREKTERVNEH